MYIELPEKLRDFKSIIKSTKKKCIRIETDDKYTLSLWDSKFGGDPYLPKGFDISQIDDKTLLAQINFQELPENKLLPPTGILQFYVSHGFYTTELNSRNESTFTIIYLSEVIEDIDKCIQDFSFLNDPYSDETLIKVPHGLSFYLEEDYLSETDYSFEKVFGKDQYDFFEEFEDEAEDIVDEYSEFANADEHKLLGNPYIINDDPRQAEQFAHLKYVNLLQIDSIDEVVNWGDGGIGYFFIPAKDLKKMDFSRVVHHWSCL